MMKPRILQRELKNTEKLIDGLGVSWWDYQLNGDVLHRILYYFCIKFIKEESVCERRYNTRDLISYFKGEIAHDSLKRFIKRNKQEEINVIL